MLKKDNVDNIPRREGKEFIKAMQLVEGKNFNFANHKLAFEIIDRLEKERGGGWQSGQNLRIAITFMPDVEHVWQPIVV